MNARQKAKKYKRLYTQLANMPYPKIEVYSSKVVPLKMYHVFADWELERNEQRLIQECKYMLLNEASKYVDIKIYDDDSGAGRKRIEATLLVYAVNS